MSNLLPSQALPTAAAPSPPIVVTELTRQSNKRSIPSLDGLRAVSVISVIFSHFNGFSTLPKTGLLHDLMTLIGLGGLGVSTFFVISGFLITSLLLQEQEHHGAVKLGRFYFRRALRIFPPFYVYLLVAGLVAVVEHRVISYKLLLASAAYIMNYVPYRSVETTPSFWYIAHTWSLAVEEQFYLFWPLVLVRSTRPRAVNWCVATIAIVPLLRLATLLRMPIYGEAEQWSRVFHGSADLLAYGCLAALLLRRKGFQAGLERWFRPEMIAAAIIVLPISVLLQSHTPAWFSAVITLSLVGVVLTFLLLWVVLRPQTPAGRLLNWGPVRHLGLISYSLYLWQQMFVGPLWAPNRLINLVTAVAVAEVSFWGLERPSLWLRASLERRWFAQSSN